MAQFQCETWTSVSSGFPAPVHTACVSGHVQGHGQASSFPSTLGGGPMSIEALCRNWAGLMSLLTFTFPLMITWWVSLLHCFEAFLWLFG